MNLKEIDFYQNIQIEKDGIFESLGFVSHAANQMMVFLESNEYLPELLENPVISCVVTTPELANTLPDRYGVLTCETPRKAFFEIHNQLAQSEFYWKEFKSEISSDARLHPTAFIAEKNVRIGKRVLVEPHVTILEKCIIEDDVIIRSGAVIGCQGYEFKDLGYTLMPVAHAGGVLVHSRAEIQGNTVVDKAVFNGFTEIGEDVKIDNLVHVAHNVKIGPRSRIVAMAMLGGSVVIGSDVWIGPSSVISNGVRIGDRAFVTLGSVVTRDVAPGQHVTGNFAIEHNKFLAFLKTIR